MDLHHLSPAGLPAHRGSMAGLHDPLPTLRRYPRGDRRTAWGRCGSLFLHRISPPTPCQSPGALPRFLLLSFLKGFALADRQTNGFQLVVALHETQDLAVGENRAIVADDPKLKVN